MRSKKIKSQGSRVCHQRTLVAYIAFLWPLPDLVSSEKWQSNANANLKEESSKNPILQVFAQIQLCFTIQRTKFPYLVLSLGQNISFQDISMSISWISLQEFARGLDEIQNKFPYQEIWASWSPWSRGVAKLTLQFFQVHLYVLICTVHRMYPDSPTMAVTQNPFIF